MATMTFYIVPDGSGSGGEPFTKWVVGFAAPEGNLYPIQIPLALTPGAPIQKLVDLLKGTVAALVRPTGLPPDSYGVVTITTPD